MNTDLPATVGDLATLARHPDGRPLRIAIYLHDVSGGGAERMRLTLVRTFRRAGADVQLVLHSRTGELTSQIPADVAVTSFETDRVLKDIVPLARFLRKSQPDILLTGLDHNNMVACVAGLYSRQSSSVVITQHNALSKETSLENSWKYRVMPICYRFLAPVAGGIVAVSKGVADDLTSLCGLERDKIDVIYNPVLDADLELRSFEPISHPWTDDRNIPFFVTAGRLVAQKDHANLLRAFAIFRRTRVARLIILGSGPLLQACQNLAAELGISADVAFMGFKENPLPYYRRAEAFILSSAYEGFGNVLVEALACGVPVISTDCPYGPSEILNQGQFGRLVPVGDPAALAVAMSQGLRQQFRSEVLQRRAAEFTAEASALNYLKLFQRIVNKRAA